MLPKGGTQPVDRAVQAVFEIDKYAFRPQAVLQLLARHKLARMFQQAQEHVERLGSQLNRNAAFAQFPGARIGLVGNEAKRLRGRFRPPHGRSQHTAGTIRS